MIRARSLAVTAPAPPCLRWPQRPPRAAEPRGRLGSAGSSGSGPIKIAVVDAQSGQASSLGHWEYDGVKLAVKQANAAGGIDGRKIVLTLFDDQGDPTVTTDIAHKVASGGYVAVFGAAESADSIAMAPILERAKIPAITSGQSPQLAALHDPYEFLNTPTSVTYDSTLANYLVKTKGTRSIAMITNNDAYGMGEHDAFKADLAALGIKPLADEVVTPDADGLQRRPHHDPARSTRRCCSSGPRRSSPA